MKKVLVIGCVVLGFTANAQEIPEVDWDELNKTKPWEITEIYKEVPVVTPGEQNQPPSDAVVLFDGTDLSSWQKSPLGIGVVMTQIEPIIQNISSLDTGKPADWKINDGNLEVVGGTGAISTKQAFGDIQLHLEWKCPKVEGKEGQAYSNSGIFIMGLYEVQILNSYENPTYANGQVGSVYKQHIPLANASRPPESWQEYDILFTAPQFSEKGRVTKPATVTVIHNGVVVQLNSVVQGPTSFIGEPYYVAHPTKMPLVLQDHGDPVQFRNIWVREL